MDQLKDVLNSVFDDCMPDSDDEVDRSKIFDALTNIFSGDETQTSRLKSEFEDILGNNETDTISRINFLTAMMKASVSTNGRFNPSNSLAEAYEYNGEGSPESLELDDLERTFSSVNSELSTDSQVTKYRDLNNHLLRQNRLLQKTAAKQKKDIEKLQREMLMKSLEEQSIIKSRNRKINDLKEQLMDLRESYAACSKRANELEDVEEELDRCIKHQKMLKVELDTSQLNYKKVSEEMVSLEDKYDKLMQENQKLNDELEDKPAMFERIEQLQNEKLELKMKLVSASDSMCPNLVGVTDEEISPDRILITYPMRERGMSIDQELSMLKNVPSTFEKSASDHEKSFCESSVQTEDWSRLDTTCLKATQTDESGVIKTEQDQSQQEKCNCSCDEKTLVEASSQTHETRASRDSLISKAIQTDVEIIEVLRGRKVTSNILCLPSTESTQKASSTQTQRVIRPYQSSQGTQTEERGTVSRNARAIAIWTRSRDDSEDSAIFRNDSDCWCSDNSQRDTTTSYSEILSSDSTTILTSLHSSINSESSFNTSVLSSSSSLMISFVIIVCACAFCSVVIDRNVIFRVADFIDAFMSRTITQIVNLVRSSVKLEYRGGPPPH